MVVDFIIHLYNTFGRVSIKWIRFKIMNIKTGDGQKLSPVFVSFLLGLKE